MIGEGMAEESSLHHGAIIRGVCLHYCAFNFPLFLLIWTPSQMERSSYLQGKYFHCFSSCCDKTLWPSRLQQNRHVAASHSRFCLSIVEGVSSQWELDISLKQWLHSIHKQKDKKDECLLLHSFFIYTFQDPHQRMIHPHDCSVFSHKLLNQNNPPGQEVNLL